MHFFDENVRICHDYFVTLHRKFIKQFLFNN